MSCFIEYRACVAQLSFLAAKSTLKTKVVAKNPLVVSSLLVTIIHCCVYLSYCN